MLSRIKQRFVMVAALSAAGLIAGPTQAGLLLSDNFDTSVGTGINADLANRQAGSLETVSYTGNNVSIFSNTRARASIGQTGGAHLFPDHDFSTPDIASAGGFVVNYDILSNSGWLAFAVGRPTNSLSVGAHPYASADSNFSLLIFGGGEWRAAVGTTVVDTGTVAGTGSVEVKIATSGFTAGSAASATVTIAGTEVLTNQAFTWDGTANYLQFTTWKSTSDIDNLAISTIPEPGSLALMGLGGLLIARRRRD